MLPSKYPIIQAPMAGVSTVRLAAAVANAGAIGSLGLAGKSATQVRSELEELKRETKCPVNVNFFCFKQLEPNHKLNQEWLRFLAPLFQAAHVPAPTELKPVYEPFSSQVCDVLLELKPEIVSFHFGLPSPAMVSALKDAGIMLLSTATCVDEALHLQSAGMDAVVAQGFEAGGHRGIFDPLAQSDEQLTTLDLVDALATCESFHLPIVAAGGIMDGADIQIALQHGAVAVQLGTAFISCEESSASPEYKQRLLQGRKTLMQRLVSGRYARGLLNEFVEFALPNQANVPPFPFAYDAQKQLAKASPLYTNEWAGMHSRKCRPMPAAELVKLLVKEANL